MRFICSWEKEIQKDLDDRKKSVVWALENGSIEKSDDSDIIMKSGAEIKSKLMGDRADISVGLAESGVKLNELFKSLGVEPEKEISEGVKLYSFTQIEKSETGDIMRKCNNLRIKKLTQSKKLNYLNTLIGGVKEESEYKLNNRIASELGF